jgi:hypothetical protein
LVNNQALSKLKRELATRLQKGCESGAEVLRDNTPIDTKRLWESTRGDTASINGDLISCRIVAGGLSLYGINRETDIRREVDYAIFVESRTNYARESLGEISKTILDNL